MFRLTPNNVLEYIFQMFSLQSISLKNCSFFLVYLLYFQLAGGVNEKLVDLTNFYRDLFPEKEKEYVVWDLDLNTIREVCKINLNKLLRQTNFRTVSKVSNYLEVCFRGKQIL